MVVFRQSGCILVEMVVVGPGGCIRAKLLYWGKLVVFGKKVVLFGQKWLYSEKNGSVRAKVVVFREKRGVFGQSACDRSKVVVIG